MARSDECSGNYGAIVVGAGVGGLTAAALLAKRGIKVLVVERHRLPGGNCTSWRRRISANGRESEFVFDCGVQDISGLGLDGPLTNLLHKLGATNRIAWKRVHHLYWKNGLRIAGGRTSAEYIEALCRQFPGEAAGITDFFAEIDGIYRELYSEVGNTGGIPMSPTTKELPFWAEKHPYTVRWLKRSFEEMLRHYFSDSAIHEVLQIISEYITEDPRRPLVQEMAPLFGYHFDGGYYPCGGSQRLPEVLASIVEEHHGKILYDTSAQNIIVEDDHVTGILTSQGEQIFAPTVIANGDVVATLIDLIDKHTLPNRYANRIARLGRGPSAIVVSVGLSTVMPLPARIFIQNCGRSFGVGNPSTLDETLAPEGHSAVTILLLLSEAEASTWLDKERAGYANRKEEIANELFAAIETSVFPDFRKHIIYKEIATPASFAAFTGARNGNIYGATCAEWRPGLQSPIAGLLLVGGGTETGPGIEAVVISGMRAANLLSDVQMNSAHIR